MITLSAKCPHCFHRNRIRSFAPDRVTLERERGEEVSFVCSDCGNNATVHINKVEARPRTWPVTIVWLICGTLFAVVILTGAWANIFVLLLLGGIFGLPFAAKNAVAKSARVFNDYRIKE